jgi:hypothetical protein
LLVFLILNLQKSFFRFFEFFCRSRGQAKVPVEVIIVDEVWSDRSEIDQDIIELLKNEEALGHALSTWDCIALGR